MGSKYKIAMKTSSMCILRGIIILGTSPNQQALKTPLYHDFLNTLRPLSRSPALAALFNQLSRKIGYRNTS